MYVSGLKEQISVNRFTTVDVWSFEQSAIERKKSVFSGMLMRLYSNMNSLLTLNSTATHFLVYDLWINKRGAALLEPLLSIINSTLQLTSCPNDLWSLKRNVLKSLKDLQKIAKIAHKITKYALKYDLCLCKTPFIKWENLF